MEVMYDDVSCCSMNAVCWIIRAVTMLYYALLQTAMLVWGRVRQFDIKCEESAPVNEERIKKLKSAPQTPPEDADLSSKIFFWLPSSYVHFVTGNLLNPFFEVFLSEVFHSHQDLTLN